ncbi:unnamed protein product [Leptosia nina]|uniref:UDP-glucuronosyltransferase n=1 Tax=Leptosia nina TaxID=320188 RepID=A0AAV1JE95_9NEOP
MLETVKVYVFCCVISASVIETARILAVFPTPSISHQFAFRPITHELARRGHDVVVLTTDPAFPKGQAPTNLTEIDVHDISYDIWKNMQASHTGDPKDVLKNIVLMFELMTKTFEKQIQTAEFQRLMKEENDTFDVVLVEAWVRPTIGLGHVFKKPLIQISSFGAVSTQYDYFGAPNHPFLYPSAGRVRVYDMTIWEKLKELVKIVFLEWLISTTEENDNDMMKRNFGANLPSTADLFKNIKMVFLNEHQIWADNHPVPSNIVYIGGIHNRPEKDLPKEIKDFLDSSERGVIYFSFGTNIIPNLLPSEKIQIMAKVLSSLPYDVLWKWNEDVVPTNATNIKFSKWFPQSDLLRHQKVKLFITQGGLQSTDEALNAAVPMLGMPMLGDQWYNVEKYVRFGFGKQLDIMSLNEEDFRNAVVTIITNSSFKINAEKMRVLMREHPVEPLDKAVWWIEHVIQNGGDHLQPFSAGGISLLEYYEIPLILTMLLTCVIIITLIIAILRFILRFLMNGLRKI